MIEYVEIKDKSTKNLLGIIDTAKSIIWQAVYYGVGEFEIYTAATEKALNLLKIGNLVTRKNDINCGIINSLEILENPQDGRMIIARGQFAKSILNRRIIYKFADNYSVTAQILSGNVAEACWNLIQNNCGFGAPVNRRFPYFSMSNINYLPATIVDENGNPAEKQVTYDNLLDYTDALLQEYKYGSYVWLDNITKEFLYVMYSGIDRTKGNTSGNKPLIFSKEFDNLSGSTYTYSDENFKTTAIIGGEGEGLERFVTQKGDGYSGYERREMFVDASGISKTVKEDEGDEKVYTDSEYSSMLIQKSNEDFENYKSIESFTGEIDLTNSKLKYGRSMADDYYLGDLVTIEDKYINKLVNVRILSVTEVQDDNGYNISLEYGMDGDSVG